MAAPVHVSVRNIAKVFRSDRGEVLALNGVDLEVAPGEFVSIIGPSGCGKTTLLRVIGGLLEPTSGAIEIAGSPPRLAQRNKRIGYVFQEASLLPWRSVRDNVRLPLEVGGGDGAARGEVVERLLEVVRLSEFARYHPWELSGGMQQRVALARALVFDPPLLLMDEPFGALDEITRESLRFELLRIWQGTGDGGPRKTALFVTHSIPEAVLLSDRVVVLSPSPGTVRDVVDIDLPRPRREGIEEDAAFLHYAGRLRALLKEQTERLNEAIKPV
ncbi:MAG: ABC transporter ATP-binding protein [Dehalococcoidia bacterium]|nr:ABC transporter ATP-binding protein [Dehalococcoidia bacterium]